MVTSKHHAHVFNITPRTVNPSEDIPFDSNGVISCGFIHNYGSSVIIVKISGIYKLTYTVLSDISNQIAVTINNYRQYGSIYGNDTGYQNVGQLIIDVCQGDVISLRNISLNPIMLRAYNTDVYGIVNASIIIEEI
jgi:hypothetical protein